MFFCIKIFIDLEEEFMNHHSSSSSSSVYNNNIEEPYSTLDHVSHYYNDIFNYSQVSSKKQKQHHHSEEKPLIIEKYGNSIFSEQYQEHFLILNTEKAMTMCMDFILSNKLYFSQELYKKDKKADYNPIKSGQDLINYLLTNKCVMSSLNVTNLLLEYIYRRGTLLAENYIDQVDINFYSKLIKISLENVNIDKIFMFYG